MAFDNRLDLYTVVTVDGKTEYDWLSSNLNSYAPVIQRAVYKVQQDDLGRMDNISQLLYADVNFDWLLKYANNIIDIDVDLTVGRKLVIPVLTDYYNFYNTNAKVTSQTFAANNGFYSL